MAQLSANQKLTAVKAFARANGIPLDPSSVYDSKELAEAYASTDATAYEGQIIAAIEDGVPYIYALKKEESGYSLVGATESAVLEWGTI